jgi:hypothetical protein
MSARSLLRGKLHLNVGRKEFLDLENKVFLRGNECYRNNILIK